jgi:hypothetical protein
MNPPAACAVRLASRGRLLFTLFLMPLLVGLTGCAQRFEPYGGSEAARVTIKNKTPVGAVSTTFRDSAQCKEPVWFTYTGNLKPDEEVELKVPGNRPFSVLFSLSHQELVSRQNIGNQVYLTYSTKDSLSCNNVVSFTPAVGEKYLVDVRQTRVNGYLKCAYEVSRQTPGGLVQESSARLRKVIPVDPSGSHCSAD